jgi:hypothetical protein
LFFGLAALGFLVDLASGTLSWTPTPTLPWAIGFMLWSIATVLLRARDDLWPSTLKLCMIVAVYFLIAHGTTTFRSFSVVAGLVLACTLAVAAVCVYQGLQPMQCVAFQSEQDLETQGSPDGRPCVKPSDCFENPEDWELTYQCERVGLRGFTTIQGRVRYVGVLQDPNEAALAVCLGIPIAIARYQRRPGARRLLVLCLTILLAGAAAVMSQSRGGQLVFLTVFLVYFLKRYGVKGLLAALPFCVPVLLYGGREGAESSTEARLECQAAGIDMFRHSPLTGVGFGQFTEHYTQTAHNSFVLAPAELGVVGMVLWAMILWISVKVCLVSLRTATGPQSDEARTWALALLSALAGTCVGILFLSFNYHFLLGILFGLVSAYHGVRAREEPGWRLRVGVKDVALVAVANLALIALLFVYIRAKGI